MFACRVVGQLPQNIFPSLSQVYFLMNVLFMKYSAFCLPLLLILSSCANVHKNRSPELKTAHKLDNDCVEREELKILALEAEVARLSYLLEEQDEITNKLRRTILTKHQEADSCLIANEKLLGELIHSKAMLLNRGTKLEAVTLIAETTARIESKETRPLAGRKRLLVIRAGQYLEDSKIELEKENYEGASYLCRKACELINIVDSDTDQRNMQQDGVEISFSTPLYMVLIKNGNIRTAPSLDADITAVLKAGNQVSATGYKENWVKVKLEEQQDAGWVHLSLLN